MMGVSAPLGFVGASVVRLWSPVTKCVPIALVTRMEWPGMVWFVKAHGDPLTATRRFLVFLFWLPFWTVDSQLHRLGEGRRAGPDYGS